MVCIRPPVNDNGSLPLHLTIVPACYKLVLLPNWLVSKGTGNNRNEPPPTHYNAAHSNDHAVGIGVCRVKVFDIRSREPAGSLWIGVASARIHSSGRASHHSLALCRRGQWAAHAPDALADAQFVPRYQLSGHIPAEHRPRSAQPQPVRLAGHDRRHSHRAGDPGSERRVVGGDGKRARWALSHYRHRARASFCQADDPGRSDARNRTDPCLVPS